MQTIVQPQPAAGQFDGLTAATGLVEFTTDLGPPSRSTPEIHPIITSIALENAFLESLLFDCFLLGPGAAIGSLTRETVRRETAAGFSSGGCRIVVPRNSPDDADGWWTLRLVTPVLVQPATFVVTWGMGSAIDG